MSSENFTSLVKVTNSENLAEWILSDKQSKQCFLVAGKGTTCAYSSKSELKSSKQSIVLTTVGLPVIFVKLNWSFNLKVQIRKISQIKRILQLNTEINKFQSYKKNVTSSFALQKNLAKVNSQLLSGLPINSKPK
ncbi:hypothetical protein EGR_04954 [Echinococcus granulosus]|uniref:Uncharacterized protein n=1 Tax=Echinococcus granulosus TaxID=6210 RepID=W6V2Q2_ECHGR|nr:hypothetical protein EGR_04954 [Echinococcus granulosus]EUB60244.1 hypothetical protein EGR_04954 [Echinococcus granulosus]